ncbi:MAG TPA: hypothetical protein DCY00_04745 [Actinobacteria bacterium]|nr:hypothetical protein [Actinomycetota bacterium]
MIFLFSSQLLYPLLPALLFSCRSLITQAEKPGNIQKQKKIKKQKYPNQKQMMQKKKILSFKVISKCLFLSIYLLFLINSAFSQTFSDYLNYKKNGDTQKALQVLYSLTETIPPENKQYGTVLENIYLLETDIIKLLEIAEKKLPLLPDNIIKSDLMKRAALIFQLTGNIEKAESYYAASYTLNPSEKNMDILITSSVLNLETGNIEKTRYLAGFVNDVSESITKKLKAQLIIAYTDIISGNLKTGASGLLKILDQKNYDENTLYSIYKISDYYEISDVKNRSYEIILKQYGRNAIDEIKQYTLPVTPLILLNNYLQSVSTESSKIYAYLQTGSFVSMDNASNMLTKVLKTGLAGIIKEEVNKEKILYKVLVPAASEKEAENYNMILKENSIESFMIFE